MNVGNDLQRERLFRLLPTVYQAFDEREGGPLRELLSAVAEQANLIEADLERLYDNWFIETCQPWVIPYLGDLVGHQEIVRPGDDENAPQAEAAQRARAALLRRGVANVVGYRRRKGTLALLEELARGWIGWHARGVEFRRQVAGTASMHHLDRRRSCCIDLGNRRALAELGSPFDRAPRTVDVRRIDSPRTPGRYNLPAVGLFVWRLGVHRATFVPARPLASAGCYSMDPLERDLQLYVRPVPEGDVADIAGPRHLPAPLTRDRLARRGSERRRGEGRRNRERGHRGNRQASASPRYYGIGNSLAIRVRWRADGPVVDLPADRVAVGDLSDWSQEVLASRDAAGEESQPPLAVVDPELGRVRFDAAAPPTAVWTTYHYAFGANLGGGQYDRPECLPSTARRYALARWGGEAYFGSLAAAIEDWNRQSNQASPALVEICDNEDYDFACELVVEGGRSLEIRAANGCFAQARGPAGASLGVGACHVRGCAGARLVLSGIRFSLAELRISGPFDEVVLRDCTLTPGVAVLRLECPGARVLIENCIVGALVSRSPGEGRPAPDDAPPRVSIVRSVIDAAALPQESPCGKSAREPIALDDGQGGFAWGVFSFRNSTILAAARVEKIELAENALFVGALSVRQTQRGCLRFCYLPPGSQTPSRYRCQPEAAEALQAPHAHPACGPPRFRSITYGQPDYARLADDAPAPILCGAADGGELGVYHDELFGERAALLRASLAEFTPVGRDVNLLFES